MTSPWEDPRVASGLPRQLAARERLLASGASHLGWKVGFGAPASLELMEISAPLMGYLTDATRNEPGDTVDVSGWEQGIVEFEVAAYLGRDLGPGATREAAKEAVAALGPSIELANIDRPVGPGEVTEIVAGNIFHRGVVLGPPDHGRGGLDLSGLRAHVRIDGRTRHVTDDLQAITGDYADIVATVASTLASCGQRLRAGDVIITGSVVPPISVREGSEFAFELEPMAPLSVFVR